MTINSNDHPYRVVVEEGDGTIYANNHPIKVNVEGGVVTPAEFEELEKKVDALATDLSYKGGVEDYDHLPQDPEQGDVYTAEDTGVLWVWDGIKWVALNDSKKAIIGSTDPATSTEGEPGQLYLNTTSNKLFYCAGKIGDSYTWLSTGEVNMIESISVNGTAVTPDANKNVELTIDSGVQVLTREDYNYPVNNPTQINLLALNPGVYLVDPQGTFISAGRAGSSRVYNYPFVVIVAYEPRITSSITSKFAYIFNGNNNGAVPRILRSSSEDYLIIDNLTSSYSYCALSAAKGKYLNDTKADKTAFIGTDGSAAGTAGLVPAPATTDAGKFLKADGTWGEAGGGGIKTLTTADYNYPDTGTKTTIAAWLLPTGIYTAGADLSFRPTSNSSMIFLTGGLLFVSQDGLSEKKIMWSFGDSSWHFAQVNSAGAGTPNSTPYGYQPVIKYDVENSLTTTNSGKVLDARQGKVLKDLIDSLVIKNAGAPTTATVGTVGMLYEDTTNGKLYQCTAIDNTDPQNIVYTWTEVGGGSGPAVVQTTGTSTTDVMSQNAVTGMVFADPSTKIKVQIGENATAAGDTSVALGYSSRVTAASGIAILGTSGSSSSIAIGNASVARGANGSVALGASASATHTGSVALGGSSATTQAGEVNIGTTWAAIGYNNSNYRLLTGVYDGQSAHDAATVGQTVGTTETLTVSSWSALSASDPYDYQATVSVTTTIPANGTVELVNDQAVLFATHGFAIGSVSGQDITFYSIGEPTSSVSLNIKVRS